MARSKDETVEETTEAPAKPNCEICARAKEFEDRLQKASGAHGQEAGTVAKDTFGERKVDDVLQKLAANLTSTDVKPSVGDYLRLLQYREERALDEQPKEIRVTWVEPAMTVSETAE